jgi:uncharacterized membrane protein
MTVQGQSSLGTDATSAAGLAVLLGPLGGLAMYCAERDSRFVRFHALQSVALFLLLVAGNAGFVLLTLLLGRLHQQVYLGTSRWLVGALPVLLSWLAGGAWTMYCLVLWVVLVIKALAGERWPLPVAGGLCRRITGI